MEKNSFLNVIQSDLVIVTNDTTEYSTSDKYFQGTYFSYQNYYLTTEITLNDINGHSWGQISF